MSNMSPFEIRLELLRMAKDMLVDEHYGKRQIVDFNWQQKVELSKQSGTAPPDHPGYPGFPTETEVTAKAEALNNFVSQTAVVKPTQTKK